MTREEAINEIKSWAIPSGNGREVLETLIPELAENEDERIRTNLIALVEAFGQGKHKNEMLAYLEKQKEPDNKEGDFTIYHPLKNGKGEYECIPYSFYGSLTSFSEDKDLIDFLRTCFYTKEECNDWIKQQKEQNSVKCIEYKFDSEFENQVSHLIASVLNKEYEYSVGFVKHVAQSLLGYAKNELKPDEWDKREKLLTKALQTANARIGQLFEENNKLKEQKPVPFSCGHENGQHIVFSKQEYESHPIIPTDTTSVKPRELDGKALLYTADKSYQIGFRDGVASVKPAEWSEEDEKKITFLERLIRCNVPEGQYGWTDGHKGGFISKSEAISKLKSLHPSWKPSEEQMEVLLSTQDMVRSSGYQQNAKVLASIYEQLKKLM